MDIRQSRTSIKKTWRCFKLFCFALMLCVLPACAGKYNVSEPDVLVSTSLNQELEKPTQEVSASAILEETEEPPEQSYFFPEGQLSLSAEMYPVPPDQDNPGWMYTVDQVEMRAFSHTDAPVVRTIENRVVQVLAAVRFDNEDWVLIFSPYADTLYASIGWVLGTDLCEQSDMTEIEYPVKLKAGAVDMITGEEVVFNEDYLFWAHDYTDENVMLFKSGEGKGYLVPLEDVLLPKIVDAELIFE